MRLRVCRRLLVLRTDGARESGFEHSALIVEGSSLPWTQRSVCFDYWQRAWRAMASKVVLISRWWPLFWEVLVILGVSAKEESSTDP